jgi:uncharacterized protein (TIGR02452 family)
MSSQPQILRHRVIDPKRLHLQNIAQETIHAINDGYVNFQDVNMLFATQDITQSLQDITDRTQYFGPDSLRLKWWRNGPPSYLTSTAERHGDQSRTAVEISRMSTLEGARYLYQTYPTSKIGILNFASATKPGGGFINGARAQEESIARSSTLSRSLQTRQARPFYELHERDSRGGYYSHAMIYSPDVAIFRDDNGNWLCPYHVNVVTSPAVNAGLVRKLTHSGRYDTEAQILWVMKERMARILALFEHEDIRYLVLGSFGTGVFQNDVEALAKIWGELLVAPGARFADAFDQVLFAIPDANTLRKFRMGIDAASKPPKPWYSWNLL